MVILDTNFLIDLMRKKDCAINKLKNLVMNKTTINTTTINLAELYRGAYICNNREMEINKIETLVSNINVIAFDYKSAQIYGRLYHELKSCLIGDADLFIASIVLSKDDILLTKNTKHFERIKDLDIENW